MTADDRVGIGVGLLVLGLAGGAIFLFQVLPADPQLPSWLDYRFFHSFLRALPHRDRVLPEAIFDAALGVIGLVGAACFFFLGLTSADRPSEK